MKTLFVQLFLCCAALAAHHILLAQARKYNTHGKIDDNKINVHIVPHSHDDAGWQMSVDEYYFERVNDIYDSVVSSLSENKDRHFIVVETSFFAMWFREQPKEKRAIAKRLIESGQLEFINAAWCMHDEAAPLYREMVDQTTRGHQWIIKNINSTLTPKGAWQIDPFGHSNTQAWLLSAEAGMPSLFFARMDYQDRIPKIKSKDLEWVWEGSKSLGSKAKVFAGQLFGQGVDWLGYSSWVQFDDTFAEFRNYVQDDKYLHDYNVEEWVEKIIRFAKQEAAAYKTNHQMWTVGGDFAFQVARRYYRNLDKLIHYVNKNGTVNMLYSTPTKYLDAKYRSVMNKTTLAVVSQPASPVNDVGTTSLVEEVFQFTFDKRHEDIFPLGDAPHQYWTGYFSSRLAVKKLVRNSGSWLNIARQVEAWMPVSKYQVGVLDDTEFESDDDAIDEEKDNKIPTEHQDQNQNKLPAKSHGSIPVGSGWTDELEGAVSVVMHHDGISGTSRQSTTNDYIQRLSEGAVIAENGIAVAYNKYVFKSDTKDSTSKQDSEPSTATTGIDHCNCHRGGPMNCLNISTCAFTSDKNTFTVVIWNPTEARSVKKGTGYLLDIPVNGNVAVEEEEFSDTPEESKDSAAKAVWKVFDIGRGIDVQTQLINVDHITANLAKLHLNKFGLTSNEITFELSKTLNNPATHRLLAFVDLAGFGYSTFRISKGSAKETQPSKKVEEKTTTIQATEDDNGKEVKPERREEIKEEHVIPNSKVEPDVSYSHMISTKERLLRGDDNNDSNLKKDSQVAGKYPIRISNEYFEIEFDADTNHMKKITNLVSNVEIDIDVEWGWYKASEGGCSPMSVQMPSEIRCSMQASGAYIFRPYDNVLHYPHDDFSFSDSKEALEALADIKKKLKTEVVEGPVVSEVRQTYSSWASHVVRLVQGKPAIEIEWTAGPIPIENHWLLGEEELNGAKEKNWGKELIIKYKTSLKNKGEFYTDANGREMQKRIVNKRGPSFPKMLEFRDEPISSNYYPVNTIIAIDDESKNIEMAVLTDMTQGGSSIRDGEIELMVGRRLLIDDWRGVEEPLNETMCGCGDINARPGRMGEHGHLGDGGCECSGLAVRGRHWLIVDKIEEVHKQRRKLVEDMNNQPMISFTTKTPDVDVALKSFVNDNEIPENIRLITFTTNYDPILFGKEALKWDQQKTKQVLIRFSHLYEVGEHSELSKPSTFSLAKVFSKVGAGFIVDQFKEVSLTGNQPIEEMDKFASKYNWPLKSGDSNEEDSSGSSTDGNNKRSRLNGSDPQGIVTINPMEVRTFVARITYE